MKKTLLLFGLMIGFITNISAQFTLSGELRPRLELRHGYRTLPSKNAEMAAFVNQRSRLNLLYESVGFNAFVSFQEVRTWGGKGMFETEPGLGLHQAYVEIPFLNMFLLKIGRQELRYNNQRIFGINNWNQAGRAHDAAVLKFSDMGWTLHLGAAYNQSIDTTFGSNYKGKEYKSLNYLWLDKKFGKINLNGLVVLDGYQDNADNLKTHFRSTYGGIVTWKPGTGSVELHAYKQGGKTQKGQEINAWYLNLVGRTKPADEIDLAVGAEFISGNDRTKTESKCRTFNPLYSANHAFNGHLDYFTNIPVHTDSAGLIDLYLNLVYRLSDKVNFKADYHYFATQNKLADDDGKTIDKYLGSEIDLGVQILFSKQLDLQFGYSTMFASKSMKYIRNVSHKEPVHWGWVMLTVKPVFFANNTKP